MALNRHTPSLASRPSHLRFLETGKQLVLHHICPYGVFQHTGRDILGVKILKDMTIGELREELIREYWKHGDGIDSTIKHFTTHEFETAMGKAFTRYLTQGGKEDDLAFPDWNDRVHKYSHATAFYTVE